MEGSGQDHEFRIGRKGRVRDLPRDRRHHFAGRAGDPAGRRWRPWRRSWRPRTVAPAADTATRRGVRVSPGRRRQVGAGRNGSGRRGRMPVLSTRTSIVLAGDVGARSALPPALDRRHRVRAFRRSHGGKSSMAPGNRCPRRGLVASDQVRLPSIAIGGDRLAVGAPGARHRGRGVRFSSVGRSGGWARRPRWRAASLPGQCTGSRRPLNERCGQGRPGDSPVHPPPSLRRGSAAVVTGRQFRHGGPAQQFVLRTMRTPAGAAPRRRSVRESGMVMVFEQPIRRRPVARGGARSRRLTIPRHDSARRWQQSATRSGSAHRWPTGWGGSIAPRPIADGELGRHDRS